MTAQRTPFALDTDANRVELQRLVWSCECHGQASVPLMQDPGVDL